mmetsp:Transcript_12082/g.35900  ORF Transcript_12082/g.35900 Transcript_12082/m.35900 type:complete len:202 (+) Transcript_12082:208-813(+)
MSSASKSFSCSAATSITCLTRLWYSPSPGWSFSQPFVTTSAFLTRGGSPGAPGGTCGQITMGWRRSRKPICPSMDFRRRAGPVDLPSFTPVTMTPDDPTWNIGTCDATDPCVACDACDGWRAGAGAADEADACDTGAALPDIDRVLVGGGLADADAGRIPASEEDSGRMPAPEEEPGRVEEPPRGAGGARSSWVPNVGASP